MEIWSLQSQPLETGEGVRWRLDQNGTAASFGAVLAAWREDGSFRERWSQWLAEHDATAFRWELPALTAARFKRPFECVLVTDESLARPADARSFQEHFALGANPVVVFENLRRDATLVVPRPLTPDAAFTHLADFVRTAAIDQRQNFWKVVGQTFERLSGPQPLWLSTAGAGIPWLHVRIDQRPKYYAYAPYRLVP